jgi:hypothetical protein
MDLYAVAGQEEVRAFEIGKHPTLDAVGVKVLDSEPWPQDWMGQQALGESRKRPGFRDVVRVPEPALVARSHLSDLQNGPWAASSPTSVGGTRGENADGCLADGWHRLLMECGKRLPVQRA